MTASEPRVSLLGTSALLFEAPGETDLRTQRRIWSLAREAETWPEVCEAVPGVNNLLVSFTKPPRQFGRWKSVWPWPGRRRSPCRSPAASSNCRSSMAATAARTWRMSWHIPSSRVEEIVAIHSEPVYPVYALGSHPGYCYLGGMDPRIATPRRKVPILRLPGGAVSIGGAQTGVSASDGPSGWNTIGTTSMRFFDATLDPPALLQPGDGIVFKVAGVLR